MTHMQPTPTADRHLAFWIKSLSSTYKGGFVYAIQGKPGTAVKIGYTDNPRVRLKALQTANPDRLRLLYLVPGNLWTEQALHTAFRFAGLHSEWFGGERLSEVLSRFADLADRMVEAYDGSGHPPTVTSKLELGTSAMKGARLRDEQIAAEREASWERLTAELLAEEA